MKISEYRIVQSGEIVAYADTEAAAIKKAKKLAKDSGVKAFVEAWRTIEAFDENGRRID